MLRFLVPLVIVLAAAAAPAQAQYGPSQGGQGGQGGGEGHGHGGRGRSPSGGPSNPASTAPTPVPKPPKPENQIEIVGVVKAIDPAGRRVTIAYEAVDGLGWPRGTMPFTVYKTALLTTLTVGEKIRFKLDSQQITDAQPY
jgi:hypothetical protein